MVSLKSSSSPTKSLSSTETTGTFTSEQNTLPKPMGISSTSGWVPEIPFYFSILGIITRLLEKEIFYRPKVSILDRDFRKNTMLILLLQKPVQIALFLLLTTVLPNDSSFIFWYNQFFTGSHEPTGYLVHFLFNERTLTHCLDGKRFHIESLVWNSFLSLFFTQNFLNCGSLRTRFFVVTNTDHNSFFCSQDLNQCLTYNACSFSSHLEF